jgi:predicted permease
MGWWEEAKFVVNRFINRSKAEEELDEEIRAHLQLEAERNIERGMTPEMARYEAQRSFGNATMAKEESRDMWGLRALETFFQDIRFGLRGLIKNKNFTIVAVLTMALGIGANTIIFSIVNTVLLRSLPYPTPDRLVRIEGDNPQKGINTSNVSVPDFVEWQKESQVFEYMSLFVSGNALLTGEAETERVGAAAVSENMFALLGVSPEMGRVFTKEEMLEEDSTVAIISHGLWKRRFGSEQLILGKKINVNSRAVDVIGVMPAGFDFPNEVDMWVPLIVDYVKEPRDNRWLQAVGRLKPGVSLEQAETQLDIISGRLSAQYVDTNSGWGVHLIEFHEFLIGDIRTPFNVLMGVVLFVLLIACANVANLLLARSASRQKEIAIRMALGATRLRLMRQFLTESFLLALLGGIAGLLLSYFSIDLLISISPTDIYRIKQVSIDGRVLAFTFVFSVLTGILFGIAPALQNSKPAIEHSLKEGSRGLVKGRHQLRSTLVIAEVTLAIVLLVGAGLLLKTFLRLIEVDPGFNPENVLTMRIPLDRKKYEGPAKVVSFYQNLIERVESLPGVRSASAATNLPLRGGGFYVYKGVIPEGRQQTMEESINASYCEITPGYFRSFEIPLIKGRFFNEQDTDQSSKVIIINESLARRVWPNEDPIGKRFKMWRDEEGAREVVGVVKDARLNGLDKEPESQMYVPHTQGSSPSMSLIVKTATDAVSFNTAVRETIRTLDKDVPVFSSKTMEQVVATSASSRRFNMLLVGIFASIALLLSAIGIYGLIFYSVSQRTQEIGIRIALGAARYDIFKLVIGHGMLLVSIGVIIGLLASLALTRVMSSLLYNVSSSDPVTYFGVAFMLLVVAFVACYLPARRAATVDPITALRYE